MRLMTVGAVLLLALAPACGSSGPTGPGGNTLANGSFAARVDGSGFNATFATVLVNGQIVSVAGGNTAGQSLGFAWVDAGPGTYTVTNLSPTNGTYVAGGAAWVANVTGGSGTIVITTKTASRVAGTFSFVMIPSSGGATGSRSITQGSFDLTF